MCVCWTGGGKIDNHHNKVLELNKYLPFLTFKVLRKCNKEYRNNHALNLDVSCRYCDMMSSGYKHSLSYLIQTRGWQPYSSSTKHNIIVSTSQTLYKLYRES